MKILLLVTAMIVSSTIFADTHINCEYNFGMASFATGNIQKLKQIHKEFETNGLKYEVHIENVKEFTEVEDYITIENEKGHKITYALECK